MMKKSTQRLRAILGHLDQEARAQGLTDVEWATRAGVRKETLSRIRGRPSCDFATLEALAEALGVMLTVGNQLAAPLEGLFPDSVDREFEERLLDLCDSGDVTLERWREVGSGFFMAGLAVTLASVTGTDRRAFLELAERLHAGMTQVGVYAQWLERSPVRPSRFLPMLASERRAA
jgi:hypothetical protein